MTKFLSLLFTVLMAFGVYGADRLDSDGYPVFYLRGEMTDMWSAKDSYIFTRSGDTFTLSLPELNGKFKISGTEWEYNFGGEGSGVTVIEDAYSFYGVHDGANLEAKTLKDITITFTFQKGTPANESRPIYISANGHPAPELGVTVTEDPLPILHINVFKEGTRDYDNEIIDRNLSHKNYFQGEYWLDMNGCEWLAEYGAEEIGSAEAPLALEIKARGNFTRTGFSKKPFKLKLGKKQRLLGLSKSKHFALLAHADDNYGYLRNFTGFSLGRRIGLPWTPAQQPVEVYINGDYRGLYFLTESIRIEEERVNITELGDNVDDPALVTGGYLVELDNYDEENQIRMEEKSCVGGYRDVLRITWDTPEVYSELQKRFITDQFSKMNDAVGNNSDDLWSYMDLDDAARYYIVEELLSHTEAYHGSTYLFRDYGADQKWHFSPLWDCGNAFNGPTNGFFYHHDPYGNTWIESMRQNHMFNDKVHETWMWFMSSRFPGIEEEIGEYVSHISEAAKRDRNRWKSEPKPDGMTVMDVVDNSNMEKRRRAAIDKLTAKAKWLKESFGDYSLLGVVDEPARDTTPAAPLPPYVTISGITDITSKTFTLEEAQFFTLDGMKVSSPAPGRIYIAVTPEGAYKIRF